MSGSVQPCRVTPDSEFLRRVLENGGGNVRQCFQCATCAVVCGLANDGSRFPRKEMIWMQWGLRDRLMADPDVWICHQCNDCSTHCPRGARPADVLATIRREAILHYAVPGFLARWVNEPRHLPLVVVAPAILLVLALALRDPVGRALGFPPEVTTGGHWAYAHLFPHWLLIGFFTFFSGAAALAAAVGALRFWRAMRAADADRGRAGTARSLKDSVVEVVKSVLLHDKFAECQAHGFRYWAHMGVLYGFMSLLVATAWAVLVIYVLRPLAPSVFGYPFSFWNPMKVLANLGTLALIGGCALMIRQRLVQGREAAGSTRFDWFFLALLLGVALTGLSVELLRYADAQSMGYLLYFVHLVLVFSLLVYLPYSKFAHAVYRFVALVYAEYSGRNRLRAMVET